MNKVYLKIICVSVLAVLLSWFDPHHDIAYMIGLSMIMIVIVYQDKVEYHHQLNQYRLEKDHEIKEVTIENSFHSQVLINLIRTMDMPMIFIDQDGIIIFTNKSFRQAFEIEHLRGKNYKDIFTDELLHIVEQSYIFERQFNTVVCIHQKYYQIDSTPIFKDKVVFNGSIILFTDVSQMKEMEKMQKQFFSDISHELKTPMSAIIGSVEILKRDGINSPETFHEFIDILLKESYRMQNIINDILELSRLEQPQLSLKPVPVDVEALLKESIELFDPLAKEKQISLIYHNTINDMIIIDHSSLKTIINNLVSNAIKYSHGGIVTIKTKISQNSFFLSVQDEGIGIAKENIPFIFDRFYQVDRSRSLKISTGLGLSIVKKMVELNEGDISVESELGIGSIFIVKIPLQSPKISHNEEII